MNSTPRNIANNQPQHQQYCNPFKIAYWNAAGVTNKVNELEAFMNLHNLDVMMLAETKLNPNQMTGANITNINGYHCYTTTRPSHFRSGGVAILIKNGIKHMALQPMGLNQLQCAPVAITLNTDESLIIAPIYCPPQPTWTEQQFNLLLSNFQKLAKNNGSNNKPAGILICGDWNAKHRWWGNVKASNRGKLLMNAIHNCKFNVLATGGATHFPYGSRRRPSAIDFALYSEIEDFRLTTYSSVDLDSDHLPIHITIKVKNQTYLQNEQQRHQQHLRALRKSSNIKNFQKHLDNCILLNTEINCGQDIEDAIDILVKNIYSAAEAASRQSNRRTRHRVNDHQQHQPQQQRRQQRPPVPYSSLNRDSNFLQHLERKKIIKRLHLRLRSTLTLRLYKSCQRNLKRTLRAAKTNYYNSLFSQIDPDDRYKNQKLWKITNAIKRQPEPNWPLKGTINADPESDTNNSNARWTKSSTEKAEMFATYLEERFKPIFSNSLDDRTQICSETLLIQQQHSEQHQQLQQQLQLHDSQQSGRSTDPPFRPVRHTEVAQIIRKLNIKKSPGFDAIDNHVIKALPLKAILYLVLIYNSMLRLSHFPKQWKCASIKMILKPGKKRTELVDSYRPISLLSGFSKIFERLLMDRLFECKDFAEALPTHQFGFRLNHGTDQQLARVTQFIMRAYEERKFCSAIFIDVKEAFDRVWHAGLLNKLSKLLPANLHRLIENYLTDRTFYVNCSDGVTSRIGHINAGVPQGSVLGPILYTIFTSDMPLPSRHTWTKHQEHLIIRNNNDSNNILLSTFADDTVIMAKSTTPSSAIKLNKLYLENIIAWANKWCITINATKTAHVLFTKRRLQHVQPLEMPTINAKKILNKDKHQYLGLHLDKKLNMKHHINQLRLRLTASVLKYDWIIGRRSKLPKSSKLLLFKQCIAPIWRYAIPVWGALACKSLFKRIESRNNRIIRHISKATRYTRTQTIRDRYSLQSANEIFNMASHNFVNSLATHVNIEAKKIVSNPYIPIRLKWPRYREQLHRHIMPIQQIHGQLLLQQVNSQRSSLPTLLQLQHDNQLLRQQQQQQQRRELLLARRRQQPVQRLEEYEINNLRRCLRRGEITRDAVEERIEGQHWQIQQLIIPDLHQHQQRILPQGWLTRQQLRLRWRQQHGRLQAPTTLMTPIIEILSTSDDDNL